MSKKKVGNYRDLTPLGKKKQDEDEEKTGRLIVYITKSYKGEAI